MNEAQLRNINTNIDIDIPYVPSSSLLQYLRSNKSRGFIPLHIYDEKIIYVKTCVVCEYVN
jgi:hypothetical protein